MDNNDNKDNNNHMMEDIKEKSDELSSGNSLSDTSSLTSRKNEK